jgi:hypothetical protein
MQQLKSATDHIDLGTNSILDNIPMHKRDVMVYLEKLIVERLFGTGSWPPDPPTCRALSETFVRLGLEEHVPEQCETYRATPLGKELRVDLASAFIGLMEEWSAIHVLEEYGLIERDEVDLFYRIAEDHLLGSEVEVAQLLRSRLQKLYVRYTSPSDLKN